MRQHTAITHGILALAAVLLLIGDILWLGFRSSRPDFKSIIGDSVRNSILSRAQLTRQTGSVHGWIIEPTDGTFSIRYEGLMALPTDIESQEPPIDLISINRLSRIHGIYSPIVHETVIRMVSAQRGGEVPDEILAQFESDVIERAATVGYFDGFDRTVVAHSLQSTGEFISKRPYWPGFLENLLAIVLVLFGCRHGWLSLRAATAWARAPRQHAAVS